MMFFVCDIVHVVTMGPTYATGCFVSVVTEDTFRVTGFSVCVI